MNKNVIYFIVLFNLFILYLVILKLSLGSEKHHRDSIGAQQEKLRMP